MRTSHTITIWMFDLLDLDRALVGDLLEEHARGRSRVWYWRQVLIAIWTGIWSTVCTHKALALRAVATGCTVNGIWLFLWMKFLHIGLAPFPYTEAALLKSIACLLIILLTQTITGWIVARTHRVAAIPMVVVFVTWLTIWFFIDNFPEAQRMQPRFHPHLAWCLTPIAVEIVGLLCGGILGSGRQSGNRPQTSSPES